MQLDCYNRNWGLSFCTPKCELYNECLNYRIDRLRSMGYEQDVKNLLKSHRIVPVEEWIEENCKGN